MEGLKISDSFLAQIGFGSLTDGGAETSSLPGRWPHLDTIPCFNHTIAMEPEDLYLEGTWNHMVVHVLPPWTCERGNMSRGAPLMQCAACTLHWRSSVRRLFIRLGKRLIMPTRNHPDPRTE